MKKLFSERAGATFLGEAPPFPDWKAGLGDVWE